MEGLIIHVVVFILVGVGISIKFSIVVQGYILLAMVGIAIIKAIIDTKVKDYRDYNKFMSFISTLTDCIFGPIAVGMIITNIVYLCYLSYKWILNYSF